MTLRIGVLFSGGVDSSVALNLLRQQSGVEVTAYYLKIWLEDELAYLGDCPWETDLEFARKTCQKLDVPLKVISLQTEYHQRVVEFALSELRAGRTPSPDILCNRSIKFGAFLEKVGKEVDKVASGHYAQIMYHEEKYRLYRSPDPVKDQTYFLSRMTQEQLSRILFPLGPYEKKSIRQMATDFKLPSAERKDSQGICFLGKIKYRDFVRYHLGEKTGDIIERDTGNKLGEHQGVWFYTIGQRQGIGLSGGPWFVVEKSMNENILFVSRKKSPARNCKQFTIDEPHWIADPQGPGQYQVKLRHGPAINQAQLSKTQKGWEVELVHPDPGVAPGQSVIFYRNDECLGSAYIGN